MPNEREFRRRFQEKRGMRDIFQKAKDQRAADRDKGGKVLLIIDVQKPFLSEKTQGAVNYIQELPRQKRFRCIVQTFWRNYPGSRYEPGMRLSWGTGWAWRHGHGFTALMQKC